MALISCPDCGTQVSDAAPACPKCGRPMRAATPPAPPVVVEEKGCFMQTLNAGCLFAVAVVILIVILAVIGSLANS